MCGIAGFVSTRFNKQHLKGMTDSIRHRGPDADGFYFDEKNGAALGHRRLSIIDLSDAANQPFYSQDGRYVMVYNGEVYNYREIQERYKINPQTHSDTEIILEAFAARGVASFTDLNGMFAFAVWDTQTEKLYMVRDRVGVKPLYYFQEGDTLAFASELKAICTLPCKKEVNRETISNFLYLGYIPGTETIYKNCSKLLPGQYAIWHKGQLEINTYWKLDNQIESTVLRDEQQARNQLKELLESSVRYCMIADVPLGVFLSGGVDSSTVAAIAQSVSGSPVKTFSIGFKEEKYNESRFASQVAKHIGSEHHEFTVTEKDALELVDNLLDIYDEPYADSSAIPTLMVSKLARQHVTVALSGDGGDELFMGYGFYVWAKRLNHPLAKLLRKPVANALYYFGNNRLKRGSKLLNYPSQKEIKGHIFSQEQYFFTKEEIDALLTEPCPVTLDEKIISAARALTPAEDQSFFDLKNYLPEELLVKVDRASMHHSLEVRVPLLDHRLVEFALNLDPALKMKGDTTKYLLKEVLYDFVPRELFNRPKWGFAVPMQLWLHNELHYLLGKYLSKELIEEAGFVKYEVVDSLVKQFDGGLEYVFNRLWALILLHKWYVSKIR